MDGRIIMQKVMVLLFVCGIIYNSESHEQEWSWIFHKYFNEKNRIENRDKKIIIISKNNMTPFTQLIVSWNAIRPKEGYFSFYAQVQNSHTKQWGEWHHMFDWGRNIQQSYSSATDGSSSYAHVRLELDKHHSAHGFRIKIIPHESACLSLLYSCSIAYSHFDLFKSEIDSNMDLPSFCLSSMPKIAQFALAHEDKSRICSPVSCTMVVEYLTENLHNPIEFAQQSYDSGLKSYGSWPFNIAHAFECCPRYSFFVRRLNSFKGIYNQLSKNLPVVVSIRGVLKGALKPFPHGHLLVVIGWDNETKEVICNDPAAETNDEVIKRYSLKDFLKAWELSYRLAYMIDKYDY